MHHALDVRLAGEGGRVVLHHRKHEIATVAIRFGEIGMTA